MQIKIFKYIDEIEDAISESPPDVLGLSNYAWNHRISSEMFKFALEKNPNTITVWGGPNLPTDIIGLLKFITVKKFILNKKLRIFEINPYNKDIGTEIRKKILLYGSISKRFGKKIKYKRY